MLGVLKKSSAIYLSRSKLKNYIVKMEKTNCSQVNINNSFSIRTLKRMCVCVYISRGADGVILLKAAIFTEVNNGSMQKCHTKI